MNSTTNGTFSNVTAAPVSIGVTAAELWIQLIVFYILFCFIVLCLNSVMAVATLRTKELRSRFFVLVGCLLYCRNLLSIQLIVIGFYRVFRTVNLASGSMTRLQCHSVHVCLYFATYFELILLLLLVIDRIMAIIAFNYYRQLTIRQALLTCTAAAVLSLLAKLAPSYATMSDFAEVIPCISYNSPTNPDYNAYSQHLDLATTLLVVALYLGLAVYLRLYLIPKLTKAAQDSAGQSAMIAMRRQMKLLPLLRKLVLVHCGLTLTSRILLLVGTIVPPAYSQRATAYGGMVVTVDLLANAIILLKTNKDLRHASMALFGTTTKVEVISIAPSANRSSKSWQTTTLGRSFSMK